MTTESPPDTLSPFYRSAWTAYLVIAVVGVIWLGSHHGELTLDLFVSSTWWIDLLYGLLAALFLILFWQVGRRFIPSMREVEAWILQTVGPLNRSEVVALAIISGFSEELLFRGAMQSSWGWGWSLGIFTLLHSGPGRAFRYWTFFALIAGGVFSYLTWLRGSLLSAIVAHILVNGINMSRLMGQPDDLEPRDVPSDQT